MTAVSLDSDPAVTAAERAAALLALAARARSRAEERALTAQMLHNRAAAARRFTERATARINGQQSGEESSSDG